jgi:catalase
MSDPQRPILLHDHYLIEQLAQFNRERVPERQPHAKGSGAFGRFEVTHDVSAYTKAAVFQPSTMAETVIRFSTVAGERGSPDTQRDRLVDNVIGHLLDGVTEPVLHRVFDYFRNVDVNLGDRIEKGVRSR